MPEYTTHKIVLNQRHHSSIRDQLETQAHTQYPEVAHRLAGKRSRKSHLEDKPKRIMRWQDRVLLLLCVVVLVLIVVRTETAVGAEEEWGLQLKSANSEYTLLAIATDIELDITGLLARVEVTQNFFNGGDQWAEGVYRFPLPLGAAVDRMWVSVGERILEGEIQEKETARRIYQQATNLGKTATLVEQQRRNQFVTRLANIGPGEVVKITIAYLQNITYSDFNYSLRIPMTFTPRWTPPQNLVTQIVTPQQPEPLLHTSANSTGHTLSLSANLVSSVEYATIESHYHDVDIRRVDNGYRLQLLNPYELGDRDFELSWTPALQSNPSASLTTYNDGEAVYAQLMLAPPAASFIDPQPREVIMVIDTSGSMEGASLRQAKTALLHALQSLGPDDYFNLLQFNSTTELLFDRSVATTAVDLQAAEEYINELVSGGGTDMAPALRAALGMPEVPQHMRQVVFVTDGAVGNEHDLLQLVAQDLGDARMFTVAIGHAPNSWFMRKTAEIGRGSYIHIGNLEEVEQHMTALWGRIQTPAVTDICVDWGEPAEYYPEIIPDLYAGEPLWLFARLSSEPTMIGLCGALNGRDWSLNVNAWDAAAGSPGSDNLAVVWARKKVEALEDGLVFGADFELTQLQITRVALDFGLLTRHTSLVAVDKTPRRDGGEKLTQTSIPSLLPAGSTSQLAGFPPTATGWVTQLLLSFIVLLLATAMLWASPNLAPRSP